MLIKHTLACTAAFSLCAASTWVTAGIVQTGVRVFAADVPSGVQFMENTDGSLACCLTTATSSANVVAGNATATALAQGDSLNGTLKEKISASVAASRFVIGRNSGGTAGANMEGSINLAGPLPGLATFAGVLQGSYNILTPAPFNFQSLDNSVRIQYSFSVGSRTDNSPARPPFQGDQYFLCCGAGAFSIPLSWTQMVNPGDVIHFSLGLQTDVSVVAGLVDFDATNTFKITGIGLPPGYSFTSDATGFLSQFGGPVDPPPVGQLPEPGSLLLAGLAGRMAAATWRWGSSAKFSAPVKLF